jgi:transposase
MTGVSKKSPHKRFTRWARAGIWERIFKVLLADPKNTWVMIDSTIVRAHQQAICGKGGPKTRLWGVHEEV